MTDEDPAGVLNLVEEFARRFQSGDRDGALQLLHPQFEIEQPTSLPHGGRHHGGAGLLRMGTSFGEHWDRTISNAQRWACGETVVQLTTQTWTAKATGRSATVDVVELFTFRDGKLSGIRVFQQDTHLLLGTLTPSE